VFDRAALDRILRQVEAAAKRTGAQARAKTTSTSTTSTFSSRTSTTANTPEQQP
jgi:hypothetical protein